MITLHRPTNETPIPDGIAISLVGMAGAGKSTVGVLLAQRLGRAFLDTDRLMEATWGRCLQEVLDTSPGGIQTFLEREEAVVGRVGQQRCVIATGGSVVYRAAAVARLRLLGAVVHVDAAPATLAERIAHKPNRGLVNPGGDTLERVIAQRAPLYEAAADVTVSTECTTPEACVEEIIRQVAALDFVQRYRPPTPATVATGNDRA